MQGHSSIRRAMLRELFLRTDGDIEKVVWLGELAGQLKVPPKEAGVIARQLCEKKLVGLVGMDTEGNGKVRLTMAGLEEAERMEKPLLQRWPGEHPVLFGSMMSLVTAIVIKVLDRIWM